MSGRLRGAHEHEPVLETMSLGATPAPTKNPRMVLTGPALTSAGQGYSSVRIGDSIRVSLMLVPHGRGSLSEQLAEVLSAQQQILGRHRQPMRVTSQTVFLRNPADLDSCGELLARHYDSSWPATNFVFQPPCCGAALALEAWAIGGPGTHVKHVGPNTVSVEYDGNRWVYC